MTSKESKVIKKLTKRVKKLEARVDGLSREIQAMRESENVAVGEKPTAEAGKEPTLSLVQSSKFTQEEVALAEDLAEDAEEVADIEEKKRKMKNKK